MLPTPDNLKKLGKLLKFSDRYNISIQFWTDQTAVYISKGSVDLTDFGGDFDDTIEEATRYLNRITKEATGK